MLPQLCDTIPRSLIHLVKPSRTRRPVLDLLILLQFLLPRPANEMFAGNASGSRDRVQRMADGWKEDIAGVLILVKPCSTDLCLLPY